MDYEKAYREALESIKRIHDQADSYGKELMEKEFPELKESEGERIRKQLLNWFKDCHWDSIDDGTLKRDDIIAWLEKQGEQKPAWSDEDEDAIGMAVKALEDLCDADYPTDSFVGHYLSFDEAVKRLKVLKPQPHWKPTNEQMEALDEVCKGYYVVDVLGNDVLEKIESLYNDLKKLKS